MQISIARPRVPVCTVVLLKFAVEAFTVVVQTLSVEFCTIVFNTAEVCIVEVQSLYCRGLYN